MLIFDGGGEGLRRIEGVKADEGIVFEMNGAVGALGQRLAQNLLGAGWAGGDDDHFPTVLFFLA